MTTKIAKDSDVHVTYEDQQKINMFACVNAKLQDAKEELDTKKKDIQNLEDAEAEINMILEDDQLIPNQIGEVFVHCTQADTLERLERAKDSLKNEIKVLDNKCAEYKDTLSGLKALLYAKFGNNINLEADDD